MKLSVRDGTGPRDSRRPGGGPRPGPDDRRFKLSVGRHWDSVTAPGRVTVHGPVIRDMVATVGYYVATVTEVPKSESA